MKTITGKTSRIACILCLAFFCAQAVAQAQIERNATVIQVEGVADVQKAGATNWVAVTQGMDLAAGDTLRTSLDSKIDLQLDDGGALSLDEESQMTIDALASGQEKARFLYFFDRPVEAQKAKLKLAEGKVLASLNKLPNSQSTFRVETPKGVAGVRGTAWFVKTQKTSDTIGVHQGGAQYLAKKDEQAQPSWIAAIAKFISGGRTFGDQDPGKNTTYVPEGVQLETDASGAPLRQSGFPEEGLREFRELQVVSGQITPEAAIKPPDTQKGQIEYIDQQIVGAGGVGGSLNAAGGSLGDTDGAEVKTKDGATSAVVDPAPPNESSSSSGGGGGGGPG